jgi:hypothetical protein
MQTELSTPPRLKRRQGRRGFFACALIVLLFLPLSRALADEVSVPIELQVDLLGRVAKFERTFASKGTAPATVLVVTRTGVTSSTRAGAQLNAALSHAANLAGRPLTMVNHSFTNAAALKTAAASVAIVYLTPGLSDEVKNIAQALAGLHVLIVASAMGDVERGAVLGFELESARPKIVVNLPQARAQNLDFNSQLLRLSKVIQ